MNKIELITILRGLIKEELKNDNFIHSIIKNIIKEEVRKEVDRLLTEMEQTKEKEESLSEMVKKIDKNSRVTRIVESIGLPTTKSSSVNEKKTVPLRIYTKNPAINKLLFETELDLRTGRASVPSKEGVVPDVYQGGKEVLTESKGDDWETMPLNLNARNFNRITTSGIENKSIKSMIPAVDVEGKPMIVNVDSLPDHVKKALIRNYKPVMQKIKEIEGK